MIVQRMSEACGILEKSLGTDTRRLLCIRINGCLRRIKALQCLRGQKRIRKCVYLAAQLGLRVHLQVFRKMFVV